MITVSPVELEVMIVQSWEDLCKKDKTPSFHEALPEFTNSHRAWVTAYLKHDLNPHKAFAEVMTNKALRWSDMPKSSQQHQQRLQHWLKERLSRR